MEIAKLEHSPKAPKPANPESLSDQFMNFVEIVRILRRDCPWDSKQTNKSIAHLLVEECYETIDAIQKEDDEEFSKELGDLLLHIVMHAIMAEQRGSFNLVHVIDKISKKMVHRHPHVFSDVTVEGEEDVLKNWEALKMKEGTKSILDGVPIAMPALLRAERIQHKASKVGFDWKDSSGPWNKILEEIEELKHELDAGAKEKARNEFGDLLFALVNAARFEGIVPEEALQLTNDKFTARFRFIEKKAKESGLELKNMTLEEMDELWDKAKEEEKKRK